jgi:Fe-S cluster assembly ATP-binding protein
VREARGEPALDAFDFLGSARPRTRLGLPEAMLARPVNDGFSGGERKRNELLQLALLRRGWRCWTRSTRAWTSTACAPSSQLVQDLRSQGTAFIVVSHYLQLIESLAPDAVLRWTRAASPRPAAWRWRRHRAHRLRAGQCSPAETLEA